MHFTEEFKVKPGKKVALDKIDPGFVGQIKDKKTAIKITERNMRRIAELQEKLYAEHKQSLLIVLQGMDGSGKDGTIKSFSRNIGHFNVAAFKAPSATELDHDYLWRIHSEAPARGEITFFNRSHYEDVLAVRVNKLVPATQWKKRYAHINNFEEMLADNGTHVLKFFLHISKDEQFERFCDRFNEPSKRWKITATDLTERNKWGAYQTAYEDLLSKCSTEDAPWFVIPANRKWFRNAVISQIVLEELEKMAPAFPRMKVHKKDFPEIFGNPKKKTAANAQVPTAKAANG